MVTQSLYIVSLSPKRSPLVQSGESSHDARTMAGVTMIVATWKTVLRARATQFIHWQGTSVVVGVGFSPSAYTLRLQISTNQLSSPMLAKKLPHAMRDRAEYVSIFRSMRDIYYIYESIWILRFLQILSSEIVLLWSLLHFWSLRALWVYLFMT